LEFILPALGAGIRVLKPGNNKDATAGTSKAMTMKGVDLK